MAIIEQFYGFLDTKIELYDRPYLFMLFCDLMFIYLVI